MSDTDAAIAAFNAHLDELQDETGVELSHEQRQHVFGLSVSQGFTHDATQAAFSDLLVDDDDDDEDDEGEDELEDDPGTDRLTDHVVHDVAALEAKLGRATSDREKAAIAAAAVDTAQRHDTIDVEQAHADYVAQFQTSESRSRFYEKALAPEPPAALPDDVELDMSAPADRQVFYEQRLAGVEFEDSE